ncbi:MAG: ubiquitin-like small modifier protein 1 [Nitrososphaerota archaeon]
MQVLTKFFATLREITDKREENIELPTGSTVRDFLNELVKMYGKRAYEYIFDENGKVREYLTILLNGQALNASRIDSIQLKDRDVVVILPPIGGG